LCLWKGLPHSSQRGVSGSSMVLIWRPSDDRCQSGTARIIELELLLYLRRKAGFDWERAAHLSRGRGGI
jgi:hypothetical protein